MWHIRRRDTTITDPPGQGQTHGMTPPAPTPQLYKRHRFPAELISHYVWLYVRFSLSYRDVEEMRLKRGARIS